MENKEKLNSMNWYNQDGTIDLAKAREAYQQRNENNIYKNHGTDKAVNYGYDPNLLIENPNFKAALNDNQTRRRQKEYIQNSVGGNKKERSTPQKRKTSKSRIAALLLAAAVTVGGYIAVTNITEKAISEVHEQQNYNEAIKFVNEMVSSNTHRTPDGQSYYYDNQNIAKDTYEMLSYMPEFTNNILYLIETSMGNNAYNSQNNMNVMFNSLAGLAKSDPTSPLAQKLGNATSMDEYRTSLGYNNFDAWANDMKKDTKVNSDVLIAKANLYFDSQGEHKGRSN